MPTVVLPIYCRCTLYTTQAQGHHVSVHGRRCTRFSWMKALVQCSPVLSSQICLVLQMLWMHRLLRCMRVSCQIGAPFDVLSDYEDVPFAISM